MRKNLTYFVVLLCFVPYFYLGSEINKANFENEKFGLLPPNVYPLENTVSINQNIGETGVVLIKGNFTKPLTNDAIRLSVKYKNSSGIWIEAWCKNFGATEEFNGNLSATFELPASLVGVYEIKIDIESNTTLSNAQAITWEKAISHYKQGDYTINPCSQELQENKYTILLTPKKDATVITSGTAVVGLQDRINSSHIFNKNDNVIFNINKPAVLTTDSNGAKSITITNNGNITDILGSTPEVNYSATATRPIPYLYSYNDPVYVVAGKFSINGFLMKFSQWPGDINGPGYHDFRNPNALVSRYFNFYNYLDQKISDLFTEQEPIVMVSSKRTGFRIYKQNGTFIQITGNSNYNNGTYFGYPPDQGGGMRGPGSEDFIISNTNSITLYGMGAIRNDQFGDHALPLSDIETEISKFINYVGIFGSYSGGGNNCSSQCIVINSGANPDFSPLDWTKAPNSYIFDPNSNNGDGILIPVKKAYAMWEKDKFIGNSPIPSGSVTADVLWEDNHGLIKSGTNYALELIGSGENAKIKVPINKAKEGNAVIAYKVNGTVYWSWHVWVTDNPTNGSTYKSFPNVKREKPDGTTEVIPDTEWKWMDRNLGAVASTITEGQGIKNGGLLYQWGRKDPIPPLVYKGSDFYEVSGSIGRIRHGQSRNLINAQKIDNLSKYILLNNANVTNNIKLSVNNPLSLIYVNKNDNSGPAYYDPTSNLPVNWFGTSSSFTSDKLSELNLWSDNSKGQIQYGYNEDSSAAPYKNKSAYDPCPNGWRIPSMLVANLASNAYLDDIRVDFSPFGVRTNMGNNDFNSNNYHIIKPNDNTNPNFIKGIKVYSNFGMDFSNVGGFNMGVFPGTGELIRGIQNGQYSDQHHTSLWTATMAKHFDTTPVVSARLLALVPDKAQPDIPDPSLPSVTGRYYYQPLFGAYTSDAKGCRCIKDPLNIVAQYDFPTEFFTDNSNYTEGLYQPNSYQMVKSATVFTIEIPVSKAFSVQSQLLNNTGILNSSNFNNLKANVLWSTNTNLISKVTIQNPTPNSITALSNSKILVEIKPNQSGNAVVTLHNGSITNPVYWSWHIWITDTPVSSYTYTTELPDANAPNYINYVKKAGVFKTEFMDRNLGATYAFPMVVNPLTPNATEIAQIKASTGLHYQWGRKDPLPVFQNAYDMANSNVFLGTTSATGLVTYTTLTPATYNTIGGNYIVPYNTYSNAANANVLSTDKPFEKVAKILNYSASKPMVYLVPSTFATYPGTANANNTNGTDWLATEPNLAFDRWGRGENKSPFDPCPEGWRIPDLSATGFETNADFGLTPWYKKDLNVATAYSAVTDYLGTRVRNASTTSTVGYMYKNTNYKIGNFPKLGTRGFRNVTANGTSTGTFEVINFQYPLIWTASLNSNYRGRPINVWFDVASTANRTIAFHDNNDPYFAAGCRCVKIKTDENGLQQGAIPKLQVTSLTGKPASNIYTKAELEVIVKEDKLKVYPNPVVDNLYIDGDSNRLYHFQLYNSSGQIVTKGKFENNKISLTGLPSGIYLIRINDSNEVFKIIKK